jgi:hypothetical protein
MIAGALIVMAAYLSFGLGFALLLALGGVKRIDAHADHGSWGFRLLIIPGAAALWPLLIHRWWRGLRHPPEECTAHRRAAKSAPSS